VRRTALPVLSILLAVALGCAGADTGVRTPTELERQVRGLGLDPGEVVLPFAIDGEMAAWLAAELGDLSGVDDEERLDRIMELVLLPTDEGGLGVAYERRATATAGEVFRTRRANCLAFANLYAGFARAAGIPVRFYQVDEVGGYGREGDFLVTSEHVTVGYPWKGRQDDVLFLTFTVGPEVDFSRARPISDLTAIALYYSNLGTEALRDGTPGAVELFETAVALDPELAQGWSNLGVARRHAGDLAGAERAYLQSLSLDPRRTSAFHNLAALFALHGDRREELEATLARAEQKGTGRNPLTFVALGDLARSLGHGDTAGRFYRRAHRRGQAEPEVLAALGLWELETGRREAAEKRLRRAREIDPSEPGHPRVEELEHALAETRTPPALRD
jgi:Flp pilus assembly protein TadD